MKSWNLEALPADAHAPRILSSTDEARVVALALPAEERLEDHEVHERAWLFVIGGEVAVSAGSDGPVRAGPGTLFEFAPQERHEVLGHSDARLLLFLAPWPGDGHPGAMSLERKAQARADAAEHSARVESRRTE